MNFRVFWLQAWMMTLANMKTRYRDTIAGLVWVVLGPLIVFGVQSFVFTRILWIEMPNYYQFLLSGLLVWIFLQQSIDLCAPLFVNYKQILTSMTVRPSVLIIAQILDNLVNFFIAFTLILIPSIVVGDAQINPWGLLLLPIPIIIILLGTYSLCMIVAILNVFYRDTRFILSFLLSIGYYVTPIFYPIEMVPIEFRWVMEINPIYRLMDPFRRAIYNFEAGLFWQAAGIGLIVAISFALIAALLWRRKRNEIYFHL